MKLIRNIFFLQSFSDAKQCSFADDASGIGTVAGAMFQQIQTDLCFKLFILIQVLKRSNTSHCLTVITTLSPKTKCDATFHFPLVNVYTERTKSRNKCEVAAGNRATTCFSTPSRNNNTKSLLLSSFLSLLFLCYTELTIPLNLFN